MKNMIKNSHTKASSYLLRLTVSALIVVGSSLSPVAAQQQDGLSVNETMADWRLACRKVQRDTGTASVCSISQVQKRKGSEQVLVTMHVQPVSGGAVGRFLMPLGASLKDGVTLRIDEGEPFVALAYRTCVQKGCFVPFKFDQKTINMMKQGGTLKASVVSVGNKKFGFAISLKGFTAAYNKAKSLMGVK